MNNRVTLDISIQKNAPETLRRLSRNMNIGDRIVYRRGNSVWHHRKPSVMIVAQELSDAGVVSLFQSRDGDEYVYIAEVRK